MVWRDEAGPSLLGPPGIEVDRSGIALQSRD